MTTLVPGSMINQTTLFTSSSLYSGNINAGNIATGNVSVTGTLPPPVGIYANAANSLALTTASAARVIIDANGKLLVGVGVAASGGGVMINAQGAGSNDAGIQLTNGAGGGGAINSNAGTGLQFFTFTGASGSESYTQRMVINSSGNIGVATSSPTAPLHVFGTATGTGQASAGTIIGRFMDGQGRNSVTINGGIDGNAPATNAVLNIGGGASLSYSLSTTHGANMATTFAGTTSTGLAVGGYVGIGTGTANYPLQVRRVGGAGSLGINIDNYLAIGDASSLYYAIGDTTTQPTAHIFFTRNSTAVDNVAMTIRPGGQIQMPLQAMISAKHVATETPGANGTLVQWTTYINQGGGNFTSGVYTVPVSGKYLITCSLLRNTGSSAGGVYLNVNASNIYRMFYLDSTGTTGYAMGSGQIIYSCNANDTIRFTSENANAWYGDATGLGSFTINLLG